MIGAGHGRVSIAKQKTPSFLQRQRLLIFQVPAKLLSNCINMVENYCIEWYDNIVIFNSDF